MRLFHRMSSTDGAAERLVASSRRNNGYFYFRLLAVTTITQSSNSWKYEIFHHVSTTLLIYHYVNVYVNINVKRRISEDTRLHISPLNPRQHLVNTRLVHTERTISDAILRGSDNPYVRKYRPVLRLPRFALPFSAIVVRLIAI